MYTWSDDTQEIVVKHVWGGGINQFRRATSAQRARVDILLEWEDCRRDIWQLCPLTAPPEWGGVRLLK